MPSVAKMTGRFGFRTVTRWFKAPVLVLQVQMEGNVMSCTGGSIDCQEELWWIDARSEHLSTISFISTVKEY